MACPMNGDATTPCGSSVEESALNYTSYLHLNELLNCTEPKTEVHDEHLFIIVHQAYELWFKQIILEIDSVREIFSKAIVDEREMLKVNSRLGRVVKILTLLIDQISILETMSPLDFVSFRNDLWTSSGFQSWQFRLIENKIGVKASQRIQYNSAKYRDIFEGNLHTIVEKSENEPSLAALVASWLERTPGLNTESFDFWKEFIEACNKWFNDDMEEALKETDVIKREKLIESRNSHQENFKQIFVQENYDVLVARGDRSLSWSAFKGALMIYYNRDDLLFHGPFQMLSLLMDIDVLLTKWRNGHVLLVQRQIGSKLGTGRSSGYLYLKSTVSDRYRPFLDLFQLSNYLLPTKYVKELHQSLSALQLKTL